MESNDLLVQWLAFCKRTVPGARLWLDDELFERLSARLAQDQRFCSELPAWTFAITYRGGYEYGGLTFYTKSHYPYPLRKGPGLQEFYGR
jgi:hypothetical protein